MGAAPLIETPRLVLRAHVPGDLPACAAMWAHPDVVRFIGGRPFTEEEVWGRLLRYVGHWAALDFGYWAVFERDGGRFAGEVGFADFKRDLVPPLGDAPEIGWALCPWAHGRGFATEAVRAAVEWGDRVFGPARRTVCIIGPQNVASIRVAQKCGYVERLRTTYKGEPTVLFERTGVARLSSH